MLNCSEKLDFLTIFPNMYTVKFWFRYTLLQYFQTDAVFFYQGTVSAIKLRKHLTKFKITIALPEKVDSKGLITAVKVTKI